MKILMLMSVAVVAMVVMAGCATSPSLTIEGPSNTRVDATETFSATTKGAYPTYGVVYTDWGFAEGDRKTCEVDTGGWAPPAIADENGVVIDLIAWTFPARGTYWICAGSWIYPGVNGADPTLVADWHRVVVR